MKGLHSSLTECVTVGIFILQKNDSWECRTQNTNHFLALFETLWLHYHLYFLHTVTAPTENVVFFLIHLSDWVRKSQHLIDTYIPPQHLFVTLSPSSSLNSVVSVWVLCLCHAAVPPHSSLTSSCHLKTVLTREKERENGAEGRIWQQWQTARRQERVAQWDHRCCDAMEMLVAPTQALHDNFELKMFKHNMADVYGLFELIVEYNLRGYGLPLQQWIFSLPSINTKKLK